MERRSVLWSALLSPTTFLFGKQKKAFATSPRFQDEGPRNVVTFVRRPADGAVAAHWQQIRFEDVRAGMLIMTVGCGVTVWTASSDAQPCEPTVYADGTKQDNWQIHCSDNLVDYDGDLLAARPFVNEFTGDQHP